MSKIRELLIRQAPTNFIQTLLPSISAWTTHGFSLITSPSKMTTVLIRRNAPNDSCHNLTALMSRCTKTSFIITPHYTCAHRNSDNLHNADFVGNSAVGEWWTCTFWWSYAFTVTGLTYLDCIINKPTTQMIIGHFIFRYLESFSNVYLDITLAVCRDPCSLTHGRQQLLVCTHIY